VSYLWTAPSAWVYRQSLPATTVGVESINTYDSIMSVKRMTVSVEADLADAVRHAADTDDQNVSSWLAEAARRQLNVRGLREVVREWENEHGAFDDAELALARQRIDADS